MDLRQHIEALFAANGQPAPTIDPAINGYSLSIGRNFIVQFWEFGVEIVARTWVTGLPDKADERQALLCRLMRFQLAHLASEDFVLGLDPEDDELYLHERLSADVLNQRGVKSIMQDLVDVAARYRAIAGKERAPVATMPPPMMIRP